MKTKGQIHHIAGATLAEALVASVVIVVTVVTGFMAVQQHRSNIYRTQVAMQMIQDMEYWMEETLAQKNYFEEVWNGRGPKQQDGDFYEYRRKVQLVDDGLVQIDITGKSKASSESLFISRIVSVTP